MRLANRGTKAKIEDQTFGKTMSFTGSMRNRTKRQEMTKLNFN